MHLKFVLFTVCPIVMYLDCVLLSISHSVSYDHLYAAYLNILYLQCVLSLCIYSVSYCHLYTGCLIIMYLQCVLSSCIYCVSYYHVFTMCLICLQDMAALPDIEKSKQTFR